MKIEFVMYRKTRLCLGLVVFSVLSVLCQTSLGQTVDSIPRFHVPGQDVPLAALERLHRLHQPAAFTNCTLWDRWLPHATLWTGEPARGRYRESLLSRRIDDIGYVAMQQHRGMAHSDGWPFPAWQQSTGQGFHFSIDQENWAVSNFGLVAASDASGWEFSDCETLGIDSTRGLQIRLTGPSASIITPKFRCGTVVAPFARIELAAKHWTNDSKMTISWLLEGESNWDRDRSVVVRTGPLGENPSYINIPLYLQPGYAGIVTRYRFQIDAPVGVQIDLKSVITAIDTRHPITNANYLRACVEYFNWTHDLEFLRVNLLRMRVALRYLIDEFGLRNHHHVAVPWVGHDGQSGLAFDRGGQKTLRPGLGVGNNYWDLLPFGGHDALATIYAYDALVMMAALEAAIEQNPTWLAQSPSASRITGDRLPENVDLSANSASELLELAEAIKTDFQTRFWSSSNQRFIGWIDRNGQSYDYGFTFLNLEAIDYGLASPAQSRAILDWLDGKRLVEGDTSQGADIYHWRFAPRATTRRNVETYVWAWSGPESIPWGGQVQDGGAVLGFSYFDIMSRLKTNGPDDAWRRLQSIIAWFIEVELAGGYRAYYQNPERGTLQGGGTAGGLGLDHEFLESVLVPQVMLYGFLGFEPTPDGFLLNPKLPSDWPALTISNIHFRNQRWTITAYQDGSHTIKILD